MELITSYTDFNTRMELFIEEAQFIKQKQKDVRDETALSVVREEIVDFTNRCASFIQHSFQPEQIELANEFRHANVSRFAFANSPKRNLEQLRKELFEDFQHKEEYLQYNTRLISIGDLFTKPELVKIGNRNKWATNEILEFVLDKLYDLYDNLYYPIKEILEWNGISIHRHGEESEYLRLLEELGLINIGPGREPNAQLTIAGKMHVEEKRKSVRENYETITASADEMNQRIDELNEELQKLGLGQKVLFEELQEIKDMYTKLNKKNWGQLVKGKLIDIAIGKLVENDTLSYIYEKITHHVLRLP